MLKRVVSVIKFIAEHGLAFRGDNELVGSPRNGNFLGILELIAQYAPFLHIISKLKVIAARDTHTSTIMKELVSAMGEQVL